MITIAVFCEDVEPLFQQAFQCRRPRRRKCIVNIRDDLGLTLFEATRLVDERRACVHWRGDFVDIVRALMGGWNAIWTECNRVATLRQSLVLTTCRPIVVSIV